jgi:hypothetical protein
MILLNLQTSVSGGFLERTANHRASLGTRRRCGLTWFCINVVLWA